jgi:hypothetical protein
MAAHLNGQGQLAEGLLDGIEQAGDVPFHGAVSYPVGMTAPLDVAYRSNSVHRGALTAEPPFRAASASNSVSGDGRGTGLERLHAPEAVGSGPDRPVTRIRAGS